MHVISCVPTPLHVSFLLLYTVFTCPLCCARNWHIVSSKFVPWLHCCVYSLICSVFMKRVTDTGCQIMTRKAHGRNAGPWLGANTVTFGIAGALVPVMELFTSSLIVQFSILSSVSVPSSHYISICLTWLDFAGLPLDSSCYCAHPCTHLFGRVYGQETCYNCF